MSSILEADGCKYSVVPGLAHLEKQAEESCSAPQVPTPAHLARHSWTGSRTLLDLRIPDRNARHAFFGFVADVARDGDLLYLDH